MDETAVFDLVKAHPDDYAGIIYVHTYGVDISVESFFLELKNISESLLIIDDKCLCSPDFSVPNTLADIVLYSTGEAKVIDIGYGGYAWLKSDIPYQRHKLRYDKRAYERLVKHYKVCVSDNREYHYSESDWLTGTKEISFEDYKKRVESQFNVTLLHKQKLNDIYESKLPPTIQLSPEYQRWRFNIFVDEKEELLQKIFANGLFASSHYASLAGIMDNGMAPNAEILYKRVINLFNDLRVGVEQAEKLVEIISRHC
jgi:hypothetical protein